MNSDRVKRPNILYIFSDQHAARIMGCAGDTGADTPNLDRLANEGTRFTRAYCPSPVCLPARMSMLTGKMPYEQSCWTNDDILDSAIPTWLHGLGATGYQPALVGRMHSLGPDQMRGYVQRPIGDHSPTWPGVQRHSLGVLNNTNSPLVDSITKSGVGQSSYQVMDQDILAQSLSFLKNYADSDRAEPFCLSVSFMLPHAPYVANQEDFDAVKDAVQPPSQPQAPNNEHPWIRKWRQAKEISATSTEDVMRARRGYYGLVRQLDRHIGSLLSVLDDNDLANDTLVVYVSDHGDHIGERGLFWKHTFFEESINVPLIMRWPDRIPAGAEQHQPVSTGSLGNTILSLVGALELPNASMRSFANLLDGQAVAPSKETPIFIEHCTDDLPSWAEGYSVQQRAVIWGRYKLVYYHSYPMQLFDLQDDPLERIDLIDNSKFEELKAELLNLILLHWSPEKIAAKIECRKADKKLLRAWAEATHPVYENRWHVVEDQNYLTNLPPS